MSPRPKWIWQNIWTTSIFALIQSLTKQPLMSWFINIQPGLWSKTFSTGAWLPASPTARQARVSDFWGHWGRPKEAYGSKIGAWFSLKISFLALFIIAFTALSLAQQSIIGQLKTIAKWSRTLGMPAFVLLKRFYLHYV